MSTVYLKRLNMFRRKLSCKIYLFKERMVLFFLRLLSRFSQKMFKMWYERYGLYLFDLNRHSHSPTCRFIGRERLGPNVVQAKKTSGIGSSYVTNGAKTFFNEQIRERKRTLELSKISN